MSSTRNSIDVRNRAAVAAISSEYLKAVCELIGDSSVSAPQVHLLTTLRIHGQIYQQDLEKYTGVKKSANSRNVAKLGQGMKPAIEPGLGLVESITDLKDRRLQYVQLTAKGHALLDEACDRAAKYMPTRE